MRNRITEVTAEGTGIGVTGKVKTSQVFCCGYEQARETWKRHGKWHRKDAG